MDILGQLKKNITMAGQTAAQKAKKTAEILKLKEQIRQDKREIKDLTYKIGKTYVRLHKNNYEEEYEEYFVSMEIIKEALSEKEKELQRIYAREHCAECGEEMSRGNVYCPSCGAAAAYDAELKEEKTIDFAEEDFADEKEEALEETPREE